MTEPGGMSSRNEPAALVRRMDWTPSPARTSMGRRMARDSVHLEILTTGPVIRSWGGLLATCNDPNQFQLTLPTMLACGVAHAVSTRFGAKPLYGNPIEARS